MRGLNIGVLDPYFCNFVVAGRLVLLGEVEVGFSSQEALEIGILLLGSQLFDNVV